MANLQTNYLGLNLKNPFIVGSSGLTSTPVQIKRFEDAGASAVVLNQFSKKKSIMNSITHWKENTKAIIMKNFMIISIIRLKN